MVGIENYEMEPRNSEMTTSAGKKQTLLIFIHRAKRQVTK